MNTRKHLWLLLVLPPIFFLLVIVALSAYYGIAGVTNTEEVSSLITGNIPLVLFIVQILILGLLAIILRKEHQKLFHFGWRDGQRSLRREISSGTLLGVGLGIVYLVALAPLHEYLQSTFGDYVPPGEVLAGLSGSVVLFFLANVLLAPFVEERLYRGRALPQLQEWFGDRKAIIISSFFFGLLHWMGGFWYMVMTGGVVGLLFGALAIKRGNIILVFVAHLSLNVVEFVYVTLR